jgi:hypothetical protein
MALQAEELFGQAIDCRDRNGRPVDIPQAIKLFQEAIGLGHPSARIHLAGIYCNEKHGLKAAPCRGVLTIWASLECVSNGEHRIFKAPRRRATSTRSPIRTRNSSRSSIPGQLRVTWCCRRTRPSPAFSLSTAPVVDRSSPRPAGACSSSRPEPTLSDNALPFLAREAPLVAAVSFRTLRSGY